MKIFVFSISAILLILAGASFAEHQRLHKPGIISSTLIGKRCWTDIGDGCPRVLVRGQAIEVIVVSAQADDGICLVEGKNFTALRNSNELYFVRDAK